MNDLYSIYECERNVTAYLAKPERSHTPEWADFHLLMLDKWGERLAATTEDYIDTCGQSLPDTITGNMWVLNNPTLNKYRTVAALRWFCDDLLTMADEELDALLATREGIGELWHNDLISLYRNIELEIGWNDEKNTCDECGADMRYAEMPCHVDRIPF